MFFSDNVNRTRSAQISEYLGFSRTMGLGKYLRVPIVHKRVTKDTFQETVDKVKSRLSRWQPTSLSLAGRSTLISTVISAIPGRVMQNASFPLNTCDVLDQCNHKFLWGSSNNQRKIHLVAWDEVCKPKKQGGLWLRQVKLQNQAFLMKLGWGLCKKKDEFWAQVLRNKYRYGDDLIPKINPKRPGSNVWAGIKKT